MSTPTSSRVPGFATEATEVDRPPVVKELVHTLIDRFHARTCLLAVCPNSETVTRAALHSAREANAPILFAATLNQVDLDCGYTGWTPQGLVDFLRQEADRIDLRVPVLPCLDHGGPWLKDRHTLEGYSYHETMHAVKESLDACIDAGYALLHIDPTVDRTLSEGAPTPIELVVERTLELMEHAETYRRASGRPPLSYEVGTEEVHGGLANIDAFTTFLSDLDSGLERLGLQDAWPSFVVGKVGTDLHTAEFDPEVAHRLTTLVEPYGALIKGHYTDYVQNPEDYPLSGMGGANVGPEFTEEEYKALMDLVRFEQKIGKRSGLAQALRDAVVESGRWKKWLQPGEQEYDFDRLDTLRQGWLVRTGSRYIWTDSRVVDARGTLYENIREYRDADAFVLERVKASIMKYFHAFNLINFNDRRQENA